MIVLGDLSDQRMTAAASFWLLATSYKMRDFKKYKVWQLSMQLASTTYSLTKTLPNDERFGLINQMRRCAVSIPSNIAEGCSRESDREFTRFLNIAIGSAFELETQYLLSVNLGLLDENAKYAESLRVLLASLNALISKIKSVSNK